MANMVLKDFPPSAGQTYGGYSPYLILVGRLKASDNLILGVLFLLDTTTVMSSSASSALTVA